MEIEKIKEIEKNIRDEWQKKHISEANPNNKPKFFITAAFPYPNSPQHIGHMRTYTITDIYARFKKMQGYNVLFPMGFHVTGTPILAMAERIKERDKELLRIFKNIYHIDEKKALSLTDPKELVLYFSHEIEEGMKLAGYNIDWRRKFYTFDKHFNKYIEWQFKKLKKKGLLVKGKHPIPYSLKLNSAVGAHDTKGDVDPQLEEIVAIKFPFRDGFILTATYRPETIFGVTNIWINPKSTIAKVKHDNEIYYITKEAYEILRHQIALELIETMPAKALINEKAKNPETKEEIPIYEANFVEPEEGTGIVMSVPAHAPYDYIALKDLGKLKLIKIIELKKMDIEDIIKKYNITNQNEKDKLEKATKEFYKLENRQGVMIAYKKGMPVNIAKEEIKQKFLNEGKALKLYIIANAPVYTREGDKVIVKTVENQWFIDYGNKEWKEKAKAYINGMSLIPPKIKTQLLLTIDWLERKACTRSRGLGTHFPFDKTQMIESLSDSTIYMAFYTIAHKIKQFDPSQLTEEFFDYLFLGKGKPINKLHEELRKEFLYWYPLDSRHSGADLIRNHLPFFILNHIAIFPKELWPKQIVVNGFVLMDGKKMSKSLGNILPLREAINKYGSDPIRFSVATGAELLEDTNFNKTIVEGIITRLNFFINLIENIKEDEYNKLDDWIASKFYMQANNIEKMFEDFELRKIGLYFFYEFYNDLKWYLERRNGKMNIKGVLKDWIRIMHPFMPYITTYLWKKMGEDNDISEEHLPKPRNIDKNILKSEELLKDIVNDIGRIKEILTKNGKKMSKIIIYIPKDWKFKFFKDLIDIDNKKELIDLINKKYYDKKAEAFGILKKMGNKIYSIDYVIDKDYIIDYIKEAKYFIENKFNLPVEIQEENKKQSLPTKFSVEII